MESFRDLVAGRHSVRRFAEGEVSQDDVVTILEAALSSPTSKNNRGWHFVVVDDKAVLSSLSGCKESGASFVGNAALAIVVCGDPLASDVWIEDCAVASAFMLLQIEDLGLGGCWVQIRERYTADGVPADEYVRVLLGIPLQLQVVSMIVVGLKSAGGKASDRELKWENVHLNVF